MKLLLLGNENTWTCPLFKLAVTSPPKLRWDDQNCCSQQIRQPSSMPRSEDLSDLLPSTTRWIWFEVINLFTMIIVLEWGYEGSGWCACLLMLFYRIMAIQYWRKTKTRIMHSKHSKISRVILNDTNVAIACVLQLQFIELFLPLGYIVLEGICQDCTPWTTSSIQDGMNALHHELIP